MRLTRDIPSKATGLDCMHHLQKKLKLKETRSMFACAMKNDDSKIYARTHGDFFHDNLWVSHENTGVLLRVITK